MYEREYTQRDIDHRYPCGSGGWVHYQVTGREHFDDVKTLLATKLQPVSAFRG